MLRFQFIYSNNNEIRIFLINQLEKFSTTLEFTCNYSEIFELSIKLNNLISELNHNLHNRVELFSQFQIEAQNLYLKCVAFFFNELKLKDNFDYIIFEYDKKLGFIPFEYLFNGEYFLAENFNIIRRLNKNKTQLNSNYTKSIGNKISIAGNFSNDSDIRNSVEKELFEIGILFEKHNMKFQGPAFGPISDEIEISNLINSSKIFHYSGHFIDGDNNGWKINSNTNFNIESFKKLNSIPNFIFSNTCGNNSKETYSDFFSNLNELGVENIIHTTGKLNTEFSKIFANLFYYEFLNGIDISNSLKNAKIKFIEKYGYSNPCWLQYSFIGNGTLKIKNSKQNNSSNPLFAILFALIFLVVFSFSIIQIKNWYNLKYQNKVVHIISNNENFKIFNSFGNYINPNKPLRIYNNDNYTFYSEGFDSLHLFFGISDSSISIDSKSPLQFIFENNLKDVIEIKNDSLIINLINNGLCDIPIQNDYEILAFIGFQNYQKKRLWKEINPNVNTIKIDPFFSDKLFLRLEYQNKRKYYKLNSQTENCQINLDLQIIYKLKSEDWIYIGF